MVIEGGEPSGNLEELKSIITFRIGKIINKTIVPKAQKEVDIVESTPSEELEREKKVKKENERIGMRTLKKLDMELKSFFPRG